MKLRHKFYFYLIIIHLFFAGIAAILLVEHRIWFMAVEMVFLMTLAFGFKLIRYLFGTLDLIKNGAEFIHERDFTTRFKEVGQPEMDRLVSVYNSMVDQLREERIRLQEQNYFLDKIMATSPSGIIIMDFDGKINMVNPAAGRILQEEDEGLAGRKLSDLGTPFADALHHLKLGESKVISLRGRRRLKCRKSCFMDRGFTRDFILLEELTEELRRSEKSAYKKLIRLMSHEVNNSVAATNSLLHSCIHYSSQLKDEDRKDFETALRTVISRTDKLNTFMKDFAEVARVPKPRVHPCDLQTLLENIYVLMESELSKRKIKWIWDIQAKPGPIMLNAGQMEQVFMNVIKNAMEAIGETGKITIRIGQQKSRIFVAVEDSGPGIHPDVRDRLFTPFFSTKKNGQGIGLTLVQEILEGHQFDFSVDSAPGIPTCFTVFFS